MSMLAKILIFVLSVVGLGIIIMYMNKIRRQNINQTDYDNLDEDEILKMEVEQGRLAIKDAGSISSLNKENPLESSPVVAIDDVGLQDKFIVIHVFAKEGQQFVGYELLQAILASGLRFGAMDIFHRYQDLAGKGPILFSLACATEPGTFEMQKMGGFSCTGLTLFFRLTNQVQDDLDRFELLLETARQLAEDLGGKLCNEHRQILCDQNLQDYRKMIN